MGVTPERFGTDAADADGGLINLTLARGFLACALLGGRGSEARSLRSRRADADRALINHSRSRDFLGRERIGRTSGRRLSFLSYNFHAEPVGGDARNVRRDATRLARRRRSSTSWIASSPIRSSRSATPRANLTPKDARRRVPALMASLLHGAGRRLLEWARLRTNDLDFERLEIVVRDGKGAKDRITMVPQRRVDRLRSHLDGVRELHAHDVAACPQQDCRSERVATRSGTALRRICRRARTTSAPFRSYSGTRT